MKANKSHIDIVDRLMRDNCGVKRCNWFIRTFATFKRYNKIVAEKYSGLSDANKRKLETIRKKMVSRAAKSREKIATMRSKARRGVI